MATTAVYAGKGASHSWTWFADVFERERHYAVSFVDEEDIRQGVLNACDSLCISGGDTFAIARGLGQEGADCIARFLQRGGIYIGTCAGAYLPLRSSLAPLNIFNFVEARIANLTGQLPAVTDQAERFCTAYGCRYVFHPVRNAVVMRMKGRLQEDAARLTAPLFGGPAMLDSDDIEVLAEYDGFTASTEYLTSPEIASATLIGRVAGAVKAFGQGSLYLFGPHIEHPAFAEANMLLMKIIMSPSAEAGKCGLPVTAGEEPAAAQSLRRLQSAVSNARILALGMEQQSFRWLIGAKHYDVEKIRVFLEAIWKRVRLMDAAAAPEQCIAGLTKSLHDIIRLLKTVRAGSDACDMANSTAAQLFDCLRLTTAAFLSLCFRVKQRGERSLRCTCISKQPHCSTA